MKFVSVILLSSALFAQRGVPTVVYRAPEKAAMASPAQRLALRAAPERWLPAVSDAELAARPRRAGLTLTGLHRSLTAADVGGEWQTARDGSSIWRLILRSPGAAGLRLHLVDFSGADGALWLTELEGSAPQSFGPYTNRGEFWTNSVAGEAVLIEYQTNSRSRTLPFRIAGISHLTEFAKTGENRAAALSCNLDVTCRPEYAELARAVVRLSFETAEGSAVCSGTVVNTRSGSFIPYLLTAAHCIATDAEARTVEAAFFYQTQSCNGQAPGATAVKRTLGARYVTGSSMEGGDFALLRLNSVPDGTVFAGWSVEELPMGAAVTGIHHPAGDLKKISWGARGDGVDVRGRAAQNFYTVNWREGVTQGGSAGSGLFNGQNELVGMLSGGPRPPTGKSECDLRPAYDWYGRFDVVYRQVRPYLEDRGGASVTNSATSEALTSGTPLRVTLPAVAGAALFSSNHGYRIQVPEGATELEVTLAAESDVDLFVSYDTAPALAGGRVRADFSATSESGNERIVINAQSNPPLRAGTYYIAMASYTAGREVQATITARTGAASAASRSTPLASGVARPFRLPAVRGGFVFQDAQAYRIEVPANATQLQIRLDTTTTGADVDLYARWGGEIAVANGQVAADHRADTDSGDEFLTINAQSTPPLRAGTYYLALGLFTTGMEVSGTITASVSTVSSGANAPPVVLSNGVARAVSLPATDAPTLTSGNLAFQIYVPEGAKRLKIEMRGAAPDVDVDMFVKFGAQAKSVDGRPEADYSTEGPAGDESLTIDAASDPPLQPGLYFIQFVNFTSGAPFAGTIVTTIERSVPAPTAPVVLTSGVPAKLALPAGTNPVLYTGPYGYRIVVPEGATRLLVRLHTATPNADLDLYLRYGADVDLTSSGELVADHFSETRSGNEMIELTRDSSPALRAGTYYIGTVLYPAGTAVAGSVVAMFERAPGATPLLGSSLPMDEAVPFRFAPVEGPTLFGGSSLYRLNVAEPGNLRLSLRTATTGADLDVHVRFEQPPAVENGRVVADLSATGETGDEDLTLPLVRPGVYYVALSAYTPGVAMEGTLRVQPIVPEAMGDEKMVRKMRTRNFVKPKVRLTGE